MNKHTEDENIMTFGNKSFDVSNVAVGKTLQGLEDFNNGVAKLQTEEITTADFTLIVSKIGVELLKHEYETLRLRMGFFEAVKQFIKRSFINTKYIYRLNKEDFENFQDWVYFQITGDKKKDLETRADMMEITTKMYQQAKDELNLTPDECLASLMTLLRDQTKHLTAYTDDHKA